MEPRLHSWISDEVNVRDNNRADFALVVKARVAAAADSDEFRSLYWNNTASRANEVVSLLEDQADGMFRWVVTALNYLHKSKHYAAMTKRLRNLHDLKYLLDLYATIWEATLAEADENDKEIMRLLILLAMYGQEPPEIRIFMDVNREPVGTSETYIVDAVDFSLESSTEHSKPSATGCRIWHFCAQTFLNTRLYGLALSAHMSRDSDCSISLFMSSSGPDVVTTTLPWPEMRSSLSFVSTRG